MKNKFLKLSENIAKYCFCFFVLLFSIANIFFTFRRFNIKGLDGDAHYLFGFNLLNLFFLILILILIYCAFKNKWNSKKTIKLFLIFSLLLGLGWILINPVELTEMDDAYNCFKAASEIAKGNLAAIGYKTYINTYPHNLPLVTYFLFIIKIFGQQNALWVIRIVNLGFIILGYYSLYKITDLLYKSEKINNILVILMFVSTQFVFYDYMVYSNAISYSLGMLSLLFFIKYDQTDSLKALTISFIAIALSASLKNNSLILLIAEIIFLVIKLMKKFDYKPILLAVMCIFILTVCSTGIVRFWEKRSESDYSNKLPLSCWIAYGLNYYEGNPGGYTNEFEKFHYENDYVVEFTELQTKQYIQNVLNTFKEKPKVMFKFYWQKFLFSFANPEYNAFYSYNEVEQNKLTESIISGNLNNIIFNIWDAASSAISLGLLCFCFLKNKRIKIDELLLAVCVFGGFLFHSFWETKSIYLYQYFLLLLPYAANGLFALFNRQS